jgi:DNA sulfur modification protein DndC
MTAPLKNPLSTEAKSNNIDTIISTLKDYYENDDKPFACGFSGGKDSSVMMDLVVKMLMQIDNPTKPVFVQFSDTLLEMDNTISQIHKTLDDLEAFAKTHNLPIIVKRVRPITSETLLSLIIGKGYQIATEARYCTDRLKIRPQMRLADEFRDLYPNGMFAIVGSRRSESRERADRLENKTINGMLKTHDTPLWSMLTPIEHLSDDDVWSYLFTQSSSWVDDVALFQSYKDASGDGDECRTMLEGESGKESKCKLSARYGCWLCFKMHGRDVALQNLGQKFSYMKKQEAFRNWLYKEGIGWKNRRNYRNDNQGNKIYDVGNHRDGMVMPSGYTMEFRKEVLTRLWKLSQEIKSERGSDLITYEELVFIQNEWIKEGDVNLGVEAITGVKLDGLDERLLSMTSALKEVLEIKVATNPEHKFSTYREISYRSFSFINVEMSPRFIAVFVAECIKNDKSNEEIVQFVSDLINDDYFNEARTKALKEFMEMRTYTHKYFPTKVESELIKQEWDSDEVGFNTFLKNDIHETITHPDDTPFSLGGDFNADYKANVKAYEPFKNVMEQFKEYQEVGDITECESISLADKMAFFD